MKKNVGWSKYKAFANDDLIVAQIIEIVFDRVSNMVEEVENAGYQHFLLSSTMFYEGFFLRDVKTQVCVVKGYSNRSEK